ncbi:MAG: hypothetical protein H6R04_720 [Burkholderiaceae bacterium]|nr:hypothetical protein [Burkholderiaceae bacterium]
MARNSKQLPQVIEPDVNVEQISADMQAVNALALMNSEKDESARATAKLLGYMLPADCTDPDLIQRDIAANMRRSVEACLEVGRGLAVLKAACGHGKFLERLDVLGIETRVAQKFIASAVKFSNAASTPLLKAIGNQTKLFEMLVLDDEQIDELAEFGQTGELALDDIATMSVKELRAKLREARENAEASARVLQARNEKIDELDASLAKKRVKTVPPEEEGNEIRKEASQIAFAAEAELRGNLRNAFQTLADHSEKTGIPHDEFMAGLACQIEHALRQLRGEFGIKDAPDGDDIPAWMRQTGSDTAVAQD